MPWGSEVTGGHEVTGSEVMGQRLLGVMCCGGQRSWGGHIGGRSSQLGVTSRGHRGQEVTERSEVMGRSHGGDVLSIGVSSRGHKGQEVTGRSEVMGSEVMGMSHGGEVLSFGVTLRGHKGQEVTGRSEVTRGHQVIGVARSRGQRSWGGHVGGRSSPLG